MELDINVRTRVNDNDELYILVDLNVSPFEIQSILGMSIMNIPKIHTLDDVKRYYNKTSNNKLNGVIDYIENYLDKSLPIQFKY